MTVDQAKFHDALLDSARPTPSGLHDGQNRPAGRRFSVYRNNVAASLTEALEVSFPAVAKLIGPGNFKTVAGIFLRQHPPQSPLIMVYGAEFPKFLETFDPLEHIGYLADVARLEQALRESYHAADATALTRMHLGQPFARDFAAAGLSFAPSVRLIRSSWPVHVIWAYNFERQCPQSGKCSARCADHAARVTTLSVAPCTERRWPFVASLIAGDLGPSL